MQINTEFYTKVQNMKKKASILIDGKKVAETEHTPTTEPSELEKESEGFSSDTIQSFVPDSDCFDFAPSGIINSRDGNCINNFELIAVGIIPKTQKL